MRASIIFTAALAASIALAPGASAQCVGDVNGDGTTNVLDLSDLLLCFGQPAIPGCAAEDINSDGMVNVLDLVDLLLDWECEVGVGPVTTLSGTITNLLTSGPIVGATIEVGEDSVVTDGFGFYTGEFPVGTYDVLYEAQFFIPQPITIELIADVPVVQDVALEPTAPVVVNVVVLDDADPGGLVDVLAEVVVLDGSTIENYAWMQTAGAHAPISGADTATATLSLGTTYDYKEELFHVLAEPPIPVEAFPPYVPPPDGEFPGGQQDRFEIAAPSLFALEEAGLIGLEVDVTTTSGLYTGDGEVHTHLPWQTNPGIRTVPIDRLVLLHGQEQATYDWALTAPGTSVAALDDAGTRYPEFTPDVPGRYDVSVTDLTAGETVTLQVWAGNWRGVIVGQDLDGRPISDSNCTGCHINLGYDKFTPWAQSGHAEIFTNNLNTSGYYNEGCFQCHSVGHDPGSSNNGFDDAFDYQDFLDSGLLGNPGDNWTAMLDDYPWAAQAANIQCENCHGPQWGLWGVDLGSHGPIQPEGEPRVSISSNVCATCHGEPLRHARFQQWQISAHANYELAIDEGDSGNCSRCHTGNGFLTWLPVLLGDEPGDPLDSITVSWTSDEVHPQTCTTCHDPHAQGTVSGSDTNATVRISGDTPPLIAGFTAYDVGRGAICMTCHNSRRGLRNDTTFDDYYLTSEAARAPHGSAQTDLLMGENAYLVATGSRGSHSFVQDTCAQCHMVLTPPPDALSHNSGGTNHTFYASREICSECHGPAFDVDIIQASTQNLLNSLQSLVEAALLDLIDEQTGLGNTIDLNGAAQITDASEVLEIVFGEYRGRQSMTVTFTDLSTFGPYRMTDVDVLDPSMVVLGQLYDFADPSLIKSGWNWALINNDGSLGVHNVIYSNQVLSASINALAP